MLKGYAVIGFDLNTEITSLHTNSADVENRGCFIALTGDKFDGRNFMPEAASRGAALITVSYTHLTLPTICSV